MSDQMHVSVSVSKLFVIVVYINFDYFVFQKVNVNYIWFDLNEDKTFCFCRYQNTIIFTHMLGL